MCNHPIKVNGNTVACGRCIACLMKKSAEWAARLDIEAKYAKTGVFLTLTYRDEEALWIDCENGETLTTLVPRDLQLFWKRVRKKNENKIKYFACGEYGGETNRAHYHAIAFGIDRDKIKDIPKHWTLGFVKVGEVTPKSIRYVANYMLLKDIHLVKPQHKPFTRMSRGIGQKYSETIEAFEHHVIHEEDKMLVGQKYKPNLPDYLLKKTCDPSTIENIKRKRVEEAEKKYKTRLEDHEKKDKLDPYGSLKRENDERERIRIERFKKLKERTKRNKL